MSTEITVTMSRDDAFEFLRQLATDDAVRTAVSHDPVGELGSRGIVIARGLVPDRAQLATKRQFAELLERLGDDPADKLGRPAGDAWAVHLVAHVYMLGALPFLPREAAPDGIA